MPPFMWSFPVTSPTEVQPFTASGLLVTRTFAPSGVREVVIHPSASAKAAPVATVNSLLIRDLLSEKDKSLNVPITSRGRVRSQARAEDVGRTDEARHAAFVVRHGAAVDAGVREAA